MRWFDEQAGRGMQRQLSACSRRVLDVAPPIVQPTHDEVLSVGTLGARGWGTCFVGNGRKAQKKGVRDSGRPDEVNPET